MRTPRIWMLPMQPTSYARLRASGVSDEMLATQVSQGRLMRLRHGVYLATAAWPDEPAAQHLMLARAEVAACPDAVMSRQSAALAWGLPVPGWRPWHTLPVSVSSPPEAGRRARSGTAAHHVEQLPAEHLARDALGCPMTGLVRTAVDLCAGLPLPEALVLLDAASRRLCAGFLANPRRSDYANPRLVEAARGQLADMARARRRTGLLPFIALADPGRESAPESLSAGHFSVAGLPTPRFQAPVRTPMGTLYPDFLWEDQRLIGECDGAVKYADGSAAFIAEKQREQVLRDLGFGMVRWLATEIMSEPGVVVDRVGRALGS